MLGLPIANDQNANVGKGVDEGWALALEWDDLSEERLQDSIDKLLNDPRCDRLISRSLERFLNIYSQLSST